MSPKVSVVIPAFNRALVVLDAIESVLAQTETDLEILVVDDGSTDGTGDVITTRYATEPRVRYQSQPNAGVTVARNAGLDRSTGDYVAFLDSDDVWQPWHLALTLAALEREPTAGLIFTDTDFIDADGIITSTSALTSLLSAYRYFSKDELFSTSSPLAALGTDIPAGYGDHRLYVGDIFSPMLMGNLVLTSTVVMRRERLEAVGRFDEGLRVGEDYEYFLRACRVGPVAFADVPDVRYRIGTSDKLGGPAMGLAMAQGYQRVLEETLAHDADRITLAPSMITLARVRAHRWVGEMELLAGQPRRARAHLAKALRISPREPGVVVLFLLTHLPPGLLLSLVETRRRLKAWAS